MLSCSMTYRYLTENRQSIPGAYFSASVSWESAAGTLLGRSKTTVTNSDGKAIGETLQVDMMTVASGAVIPSYNCTSSFSFAAISKLNTLALNDVSWTCVSEPVITWCMYFNHYFKLLTSVTLYLHNFITRVINTVN